MRDSLVRWLGWFGVVLAMVTVIWPLAGCASFRGQSDPLVAIRPDTTPSGIHVTVTVVDSEAHEAFCFYGASGVDCRFSVIFLLESTKNVTLGKSDWRFVTHNDALEICGWAARDIFSPRIGEITNQCAWNLISIRLREMKLEPDGGPE